jgi:hypothetical protein
MIPNRRKLIVGALALSTVARVSSQSHRWAALSLVGNKIEVFGARPEIGSSLSQNRRLSLDDAEGTLDRYVLQTIDRVLRSSQGPTTSLTMLAVPGSVLYDQPERAFDGRQVALPGAVVDALIASRASQLLLLTKLRGNARVPLYDTSAGVGTVQGIGFYVDNDIRLVLRDTGSTAPGLLAPFVYVKLSLVDVQSGRVVREELVREMQTYATASSPNASVPWDILSAQEKIDALRKLIDRSVGDAVGKLLRAE